MGILQDNPDFLLDFIKASSIYGASQKTFNRHHLGEIVCDNTTCAINVMTGVKRLASVIWELPKFSNSFQRNLLIY